ncbi:hypothetical protein [Salinisphaera sp.]|uniref:hypothetical protein n=1 Tax=Salinisphaera sp. TaxID=1914330 RepID=UPI002D7843B3|nr:hypothetical protein [Salinisphaera sp.]
MSAPGLKPPAAAPIDAVMQTDDNNPCIRLRRGLCFAAAMLLIAAGVGIAGAHGPHTPDAHRPHRPWPGGIGPDAPYYPEIGIGVRPELEHWPNNYRPDSYRLRGYDGRPAGHHVCRGAHGRTLSSAGTECPPGQQPEKGARHLSTNGS